MPVPVSPTPARLRGTAWVGAAGVCLYVGAWVAAGWWRAGYTPVADSISALYAVGAPAGPARLVVASLVVTGVILLPFAWALHHGLPGRGVAGPVVCALGGVATAVLAAAPCTAGCPGLGASGADTLHVVLGTVAYACLVGTPLLFAVRLAGHDRRLAAASAVLGGLAALGLVVRAAGVGVGITGLLQRVANTVADAWYVLAAVVVARRAGHDPDRSSRPGPMPTTRTEGGRSVQPSVDEQRRDPPETLVAVRRLLAEGVGAPTVRDAAEVLARVSRETLGTDHAVAYLADDDHRIGQVVPVGVPTDYVERIHDLLVGEDGDRVALWEVSKRDGHPVVTVTDADDSGLVPDDVVASLGLRSYLAFPVLGADDEVLGGVVCSHVDRTRRWQPAERGVARQLAAEGSLIIENASLRETERRQLAQLTRQALHDPLTGLSNRTVLLDRLEHALAGSQRSGATLGLIFIDVDRFKTINDTLGHNVGDRVLKAVARSLRECVREADTLARFAGDEFVVLLEDTTTTRTRTAADRLARRLRPLEVSLGGAGEDGHDRGAPPSSVDVTASLGLATISGGTIDAEALLRRADQAMYRAKRTGRSPAAYRSDRDRSPAEQNRIHRQLAEAIEQGGLRLRYQPVVHLRSGALLGLEALVRWEHPDKGLLPPDRFLPLAEETGLVGALGRWVLRAACRQLARWDADHGVHAPVRLAVNVSSRQLVAAEPLVDDVTGAAGDADVDPDRLVVEITETALLPESGGREQLDVLRGAGVRTALDDFGVGYSSLRHLQQLPVDVLKIDRTFVSGLDGDDDGTPALISAMTTLGGAFDLDVVAEGVETAAQRRELLSLGCRYAQGHHFSRPLTASRVGDLLSAPTTGPFGPRAHLTPPAG